MHLNVQKNENMFATPNNVRPIISPSPKPYRVFPCKLRIWDNSPVPIVLQGGCVKILIWNFTTYNL